MIAGMRAHLAWGVLALALLVAACSGGDGVSKSGSPPTLPAAPATTGGQSSMAANERFCAGARRADERLKQTEVAGTAQVAADQYNSAAEAVRSMVDLTPDERREDARTMARAYDAYVEELRTAGWRAPSLPAGTRENLLGAPDVRAAGGRLGAYQQQICGAAG